MENWRGRYSKLASFLENPVQLSNPCFCLFSSVLPLLEETCRADSADLLSFLISELASKKGHYCFCFFFFLLCVFLLKIYPQQACQANISKGWNSWIAHEFHVNIVERCSVNVKQNYPVDEDSELYFASSQENKAYDVLSLSQHTLERHASESFYIPGLDCFAHCPSCRMPSDESFRD